MALRAPLIYFPTDSIEIQVKQHADVKHFNKWYTCFSNVADGSGNGSAITTVPLDALLNVLFLISLFCI